MFNSNNTLYVNFPSYFAGFANPKLMAKFRMVQSRIILMIVLITFLKKLRKLGPYAQSRLR